MSDERQNCVETYRSVLGLRQEEVEDRSLHSIPNDKDDVCLPANRFKRDWPSELIQHTAGVDGKGGEGHALCAHLE